MPGHGHRRLVRLEPPRQALLAGRRVDARHQDRDVVVGTVGQHRRDQLLRARRRPARPSPRPGGPASRCRRRCPRRDAPPARRCRAPPGRWTPGRRGAGSRLNGPTPSGGFSSPPTSRHSPPGTRDDRRQVPGVGEPQAAVGRVEDGVDAGDDLVLAEVAHQAVERLQQVGRRQVEPGVGPHRRAQLAHHRRRAHAAAHHVADDQRGPPAAELDHVVPVAADLGALDAGAVVGRDLEVVEVEALLGQQAALQLVGDRVLARGRLGVGGRHREGLLGGPALGDVLHRPAQPDPVALARRAPPRRRSRPGSPTRRRGSPGTRSGTRTPRPTGPRRPGAGPRGGRPRR